MVYLSIIENGARRLKVCPLQTHPLARIVFAEPGAIGLVVDGFIAKLL